MGAVPKSRASIIEPIEAPVGAGPATGAVPVVIAGARLPFEPPADGAGPPEPPLAVVVEPPDDPDSDPPEAEPPPEVPAVDLPPPLLFEPEFDPPLPASSC